MMKSRNKLLILFNLFQIAQANNLDVVDHKNMQLKLYLDAIQYNVQEKIGVFPYVLQNKSGTYLEIGTGGDPIAELMKNIPTDYNIKIIASDVDQNVLDSVLTRHPELQQYLHAVNGPTLQLQQLNAIDMHIFPENQLDGINASSVLHEIISYAGGLDACKKFFQEAHRILKNDGVLIYRDPEFVANEQETVTVRFKNKSSKLFSHVFLYKFLDPRGSLLAEKNRKVFMYDTARVFFKIHKKNESHCGVYSYEEYLQIPSYDIDFSRKYSISLPYGLYRELARHYLTYLHECNPLVYLKTSPNITAGSHFINYWAHSTAQRLKSFLDDNAQLLQDGQISLMQKDLVDNEIEKNIQTLEFGIPLHFTSKSKEFALRQIIKEYNLDPSRYIIAIDSKTRLLDYRIFGMLYEKIKTLFDEKNNVTKLDDEKHAAWLKREGEEYYCYYSADKLISQVLLFSLEASQKALNNYKETTVLCPMNSDNNTFLNRWCYSELLKDTLDVSDHMGYPIEIFDGKRIIHFQKMDLSKAIGICKEIIQKEPLLYPELTKTIQSF